MSKLNVDQKTIEQLFSDKKADFLIPDYQRPYAWDETQCQSLWDDIFSFAFPDNNYENFDDNEEYFLGSIVTFHNEEGKSEIIDGQQRLTTILLLLRAFYDKFQNMQDENSKKISEKIERCIWQTDTFGTANKDALKIDSQVATDKDKEEFLVLLRTGIIPENAKSQYVENFKYFQEKIQEFLNTFASYFPYLPARILANCILLPIEAESQDTALRIFSTLNDRGLPLSDADIFKARFYRFYGDKDQKDEFIERWTKLEEITSSLFNSASSTPMDELFTRYMYYLRAKQGIKTSNVEALRKFFERDKYKYLKVEQTLDDLESLANFWKSVNIQDSNRFSEPILKRLFILNYAPNSIWEYITSVFFLTRRDDDENIDESSFIQFLDKITAFILAYGVTNPGLIAARTPIFNEMIEIINGNEVTFSKFKFNVNQDRQRIFDYRFTNNRPITRSMLTWYLYTFENQNLLDLNEKFQIEHIFSNKRHDMSPGDISKQQLDSLGNKILLERSINIRASDYQFEDKKKIYSGESRRGKNKDTSKIAEIQNIIEYTKFNEVEIEERNNRMIDRFFKFLEEQKLLTD